MAPGGGGGGGGGRTARRAGGSRPGAPRPGGGLAGGRELESLGRGGRREGARAPNRGLLPLSRLDMSPKVVQLFKLAQARVGRRGGPSRPPRLPLTSDEIATVDEAIATASLS